MATTKRSDSKSNFIVERIENHQGQIAPVFDGTATVSLSAAWWFRHLEIRFVVTDNASGSQATAFRADRLQATLSGLAPR